MDRACKCFWISALQAGLLRKIETRKLRDREASNGILTSPVHYGANGARPGRGGGEPWESAGDGVADSAAEG